MDHKTRRSSILKVRKEVNVLEETVVNDVPEVSTRGRRVSFQNVKHIKRYEKDHGKLLMDGSPLRERITDTLDSDGILTPRGRCPDESSNGQSVSHNGSMDMSIDNETLRSGVVYEKTTTTTVTERIIRQQPDPEDTLALFNMTSNEMKDMSIDEESVVFAAPRPPNTNVTVNESVMMEIDEEESSKMDISTNDTLAMFQSPARRSITEKRPLNETLSIFQSPRGNLSSMCLETTIEEPKDVQEVKTEENSDMDISKTIVVDDTLAMFQSPARTKIAALNGSVTMDVETPEVTPQKVIYDDRTIVEEGRAVLQTSMMDFSDVNMTQEHLTQKTLNSSRTTDPDTTNPKTMDMKTDTTITIAENTLPPADLSIRSHSSRRRSLIRESPRRMALENSMNSDMKALSEYRRRKSFNSTTTSLLNETANTSVGRDIFAMSMSVRSPLHTSQTTPEAVFEMPNFDPAVSNVFWLMPEEGQTSPSAESLEFARIVSEEKKKTEEKIQKSLLDGNLNASKAEAVRTRNWASLNHAEKQVVFIARQEAELRFLDLRIKFASEQRAKFELKARETAELYEKLAAQLADLENMETIRMEIEELKRQPTRAEYAKIESEWEEAQKWKFEMQMEALIESKRVLREIRRLQAETRLRFEEITENVAVLEDKKREKQMEMGREVRCVLE